MNLFWSRGSVHVRIVGTIAALVVVHAANAQTGISWATDASIGFTRGGGGEFVNRSHPLAEIAASVRKDVRRSFGIDAEGGYDWSANIEAEPDLCLLNSRGNCTPNFPAFGGPFGLLGVTLGPPRVIQLRLNAGLVAYTDNRTRFGAPVAAMDIAVAPISWLAIVTGGRAVVVANYLGDHLTVTTWRLGLRLQSIQTAR